MKHGLNTDQKNSFLTKIVPFDPCFICVQNEPYGYLEAYQVAFKIVAWADQ